MGRYVGQHYRAQGGDEAYEKHLSNLTRVAEAKDLLKKAGSGAWTAFAALANILQRPGLAVWGAIDTAIGTGRPDEGILHRVGSELFSGMFGLKGEKEYPVDIARELGFPEGKRLSEFIPDTPIGAKISQFFDPTVLEMTMFAAEIPTDPLFWVSSPVKFGTKGIITVENVVKGFTKGGEVPFTKAARKLVRKQYEARIRKEAQLIPDADDMPWAQLEDAVLKRMIDSDVRTSAIEHFGKVQAKLEVERAAASDIANKIATGELAKRGLAQPGGLRFRPFGLIDVPVGLDIAIAKGVGVPAKTLMRGIDAAVQSNEGFRQFVHGMESSARVQALKSIFTRVPDLAKKIPGYSALEGERWMLTQAARRSAVKDVENIFGKFANKTHKNKKVWQIFARHIDNPDKYPEQLWLEAAKSIGLDEKAAKELATNWKEINSMIGRREIAGNLLTREAFEHYDGHYFPHLLKLPINDDDWIRAFKSKKPDPDKFVGPSVKNFSEIRVTETLDDFEAALKSIDKDFLIEWDPSIVLQKRMTAHYQAMANSMYTSNLVGHFGVMTSPEAAKFLAALKHMGLPDDGKALKVTAKEMETVAQLRARSRSMVGEGASKKAVDAFIEENGLPKVLGEKGLARMRELDSAAAKKLARRAVRKNDIKMLKSLRPEVQALFLYDVFEHATTMEHFERLWRKYSKTILKDLDDGALKKARQAIVAQGGPGKMKYLGQDWVEHEFKTGGLAGKSYSLPRGIVHHLSNIEGKMLKNPEVHVLLRMLDVLPNTWKLSVTALFADFMARNARSNVAASAMDIGLSALDPKMHIRALRVMLGHEGTMKTDFGELIPLQALRNETQTIGVDVGRLVLAETTGAANTLLPRWLETGKISPVRWALKVSSFLEDEARVLHYIALRQRGYGIADSATHVNRFLFDYQDLSPIEREVFRRVFPFYTWSSKNVRRQVQNLLERPGWMRLQTTLAAEERGPTDDWFPQYMQGSMKIALRTRPGQKGTFLTGLDLPVANLDILWAGGVGKTLREQFNMVVPFLKMPLEYAFNQSSFDGKTIKGQQWAGRMGPFIDRTFSKSLKEWLNFEKKELRNGEIAYKMDGLKMWGVLKGVFLSRFVSTSINFEDFINEWKLGDKEQAAFKLMKALTGMNIAEMDFDEAQRREMKNKIEELERILTEAGEGYRFEKFTLEAENRRSARAQILR